MLIVLFKYYKVNLDQLFRPVSTNSDCLARSVQMLLFWFRSKAEAVEPI